MSESQDNAESGAKRKPLTSGREQAGAPDKSVEDVRDPLSRQSSESRGYRSPVLVILFIGSVSLLLACVIYLLRYSEGMSPLVKNRGARTVSVTSKEPSKSLDPMVLGRHIFRQNCAVCHQLDGKGIEEAFPPLAGSPYVLGNEQRLVRIVLHGLHGPVKVEGATFNGAMPYWYATLSDTKIAAVTTYIRNRWGNKAPPVKVKTVAEIRSTTAKRKDPWRIEDLDKYAN